MFSGIYCVWFDALSISLLIEDDNFYPAILTSSPRGLEYLIVQVPISNLLQVPNWTMRGRARVRRVDYTASVTVLTSRKLWLYLEKKSKQISILFYVFACSNSTLFGLPRVISLLLVCPKNWFGTPACMSLTHQKDEFDSTWPKYIGYQ